MATQNAPKQREWVPVRVEDYAGNGRPRVLVVDDEPDVRQVFELALSRNGFEVTSAESGQAALEAAEQTAYDLAFVDIAMPVMDGVETLKHLRTMSPKTQVVMITAFMDHGLESESRHDRVAEALSAGARGCLRKPFGVSTIVKTAKYFVR
jgi:CheY-like chemotaxis protein